MKVSEVPQDNISISKQLKKLYYAVDDKGDYSKVLASGWMAEEDALTYVLQYNELKAKEAAARVAAGISSPIEYFMHLRNLDITDLAQALGTFKFIVKRHFKAKPFSKLSARTVEQYARVLRVTSSELTGFKGTV